MRKVLAAVLFAAAGALLLIGGMTLSNVWADYQDSPDSTYIEVAALAFGLAAALAIGGFLALRGH